MGRKKQEKPQEDTATTKFSSMVKEVPTLRKFYLQRDEDETGLSGCGIVAVGCLFPSGLCVLEWTTPIKSVTHYHSIADLEALHGHHGKTLVKWTGEM